MKRIGNNQNKYLEKMNALAEKVKQREIKKTNTVRANREINRGIIDELIKHKKCTLLTNKDFICERLDGYRLKKGEEKLCDGPDFVNCPAFNQYTSFEIRKDRRSIAKEKVSEKKR